MAEWTMPVLSANEQTVDRITYTVTADSTHNSSFLPYKAFDGSNADTSATAGNIWHSAKATKQGTHWIMVQMTSAVKITAITLHHRMINNYMENHSIKEFVFEGSNDGETWDELCTGTCATGESGTYDDFTVANPGYYSIYRMRVVTTFSVYDYECYAVIGELNLTGYSMSTLFLIESGGNYYNVVDGELNKLSDTELSANLFTTYGTDYAPDGSLLLTLVNPKVLCWTDADEVPTLQATVTATPKEQTVISDKIDLTHSTIKGIESAVATCDGDLVVAVSFDDKQTWKAHNGTEWVTLSDDFAGMNKDTLEAITFEQWNELYNGTGFYVRISFTDTTQAVEKIVFDFAN